MNVSSENTLKILVVLYKLYALEVGLCTWFDTHAMEKVNRLTSDQYPSGDKVIDSLVSTFLEI